MSARDSGPTPLGALARGVIAGVAGTALMTAWQELSAKLMPSDASGGDPPADPWEEAPAPAKVARRLAGVFEADIPAEQIDTATNVMHWAYGTGWGAVYGLIAGSHDGRAGRDGLAFGTAVWAASYLELVPMGLYEPPWTYPPKQLALEWSFHAVYGLGAGLAYAALDRS